ncbi:hypothetical protein D3C81_1410730 [compost metagenome]
MKRLIKRSNQTVELYHGTGSQFLEGIFAKGLLPNSVTGLLNSGLESSEGTEAFIPSLNTQGIYLASEDSAEEYANSAVYVDETMPAFPVIIKVEVDDSKLLPDMDDLGSNYKFDDKSLLWEQSFEKIHQVVHNGTIDLSQIVGVRFSNSLKDIVPDENYEYEDLLEKEVKMRLGQWFSLEEMIRVINEIKNLIK